MEKNLFEIGAVIDVEALTARIRESAKKRRNLVPVAPAAKEPEQRTLKTLQTQRLTQEIHSGAVFTEVINQIPLKRRGIKGRIEFRVKKFFKWLVHWNTKGQADFNQSVTRSLGLIAQDLQTGQGNLAEVESLLRDEQQRIAQVRQTLEETGRKSDSLAVRLSELEQQASRGLVDIRSRIEKESSLVAEKLRGLEEQSAQFSRQSAIVEEVGKRMEVIAAQSSESERRMNRVLEEIRQNTQSDVTAAAAGLQKELDRNALETHELTEQVSRLSAMLADISRRSDAAVASSAAIEQEAGRMIGESTRNLQAEFGAAEAALREETNRNVEELSHLLSEQTTRLSGLLEETRSKTEALAAQSSGLEGKFSHQLDEIRMRILRGERIARTASRGIDAAAEQGKSSEHVSNPQARIRDHRTNGDKKTAKIKPAASEEPLGQPFDYFLFEHRYRGPVSEIKRRQSAYVDLFREKKNVVDLGCGRGEFVEALSDNGINVTGVDSSEDMVDFCRDRGLCVVQDDIFNYLASLPDGKLDGIFISQVVEHLPPERILELISLCAAKLDPGGVIVAETVNTNCPTALSNFYLDPTHVRPVPAEMLRFMLEQASFQVKYLRFSAPLPGNDLSEVLDLASGLSQEIIAYQDYAVVAVKR